jgi:hypothetical protein
MVMGRVKDLVIELQNEFGFDMEFLPEDFNMDEYLEKKSKEKSLDQLFCDEVNKLKSDTDFK